MNELRQAIRLFDLERYLARFTPDQEQKGELIITCPRCTKRKLVVSLAKRAWHCWQCESAGGKGGLLDLVQLLEGCERGRARDIVLQMHVAVGLNDLGALHVADPERAIRIKAPPKWRPVDDTSILPYCWIRGIGQEDAKAFRLGWCPEGRYRGRLIFPVWEGRRLVYWQARAMWEKDEHAGPGPYIKSLNPPKTEGAAGSADVLMNLDLASQHPSVVITEGPIDAIHVGNDAVCTFGKRLSSKQAAKLLSKGVKRLELMYDGPSPTEPQGAWPEMFQIAGDLIDLFDDIRLVFLPHGDPGDWSREWLTHFRQHNSRSIREYKPTQSIMEI